MTVDASAKDAVDAVGGSAASGSRCDGQDEKNADGKDVVRWVVIGL